MPVYVSGSSDPYASIPVRDANTDPNARQVFTVNPVVVGPYGGTPIRLAPSDPFAMVIRGRFPSWAMTDAALDLDFVNDQSWNGSTEGTSTSPLTMARASTAYIDDAAGTWTSVLSNILRRTDKGALIEGTRTNSIRNNSMQGVVAGTPGTAPTNWTIASAPVSLARQIVGTGTERGIDYIDVRYSGTANATQTLVVAAFDITTQIAALAAQLWSQSVFLALVAGTAPSVPTIRISERDASGNPLVQGDFSAPALTGTLVRSSGTRTLTSASTAFLQPQLVFSFTNAQVYDFTFRIGWPQLEQGAYATSPIRTTNAAVARAADNVRITGGGGVSLATGTFFVEWTDGPGPVSITGSNVYRARVDANNYMGLSRNVSNKMIPTIVTGGVAQAGTGTTNSVVAGATYKSTMAYASNDYAAAHTASLEPSVQTDVALTMFTGSFDLWVGNANNQLHLDGYLRRLTWFPTRRPNAELLTLVA